MKKEKREAQILFVRVEIIEYDKGVVGFKFMVTIECGNGVLFCWKGVE